MLFHASLNVQSLASGKSICELSGTELAVLEADWLEQQMALRDYLEHRTQPRVPNRGSNMASVMGEALQKRCLLWKRKSV